MPLIPVLMLAAALGGTPSDFASAQGKIALIESGRLPAGSRVVLTQAEVNAWARSETAGIQGVRAPRLELGAQRATGYAFIDFPKLRRAMGDPMNWILERLLAGERPVRVDAHLSSAAGWATIYLDRVEISGMAISGDSLDYLLRTFLWPRYPEATVGRPFALAHRIDHVETQPWEVRVVFGK